MSKEESAIAVSATELKKAIAAYDRASVKKQVEGGALAEVADDELTEVLKSLVQLLDHSVMEAAAKKTDKFYADMLDMDYTNYNRRYFVAELLKKHIKKFDMTDEYTAEKVFDTAVTCDAKDAIAYMIKNKLCKKQYAQIMTCSEDVYTLASKIKVKDLDNNAVVDFYLAAAFSDDAQEKIAFLKDNGYDINVKNTKDQTVVEAAEELVQSKKYAKNKSGNLEKLADETAVKTLKKAVSGDTEEKPLITKNAVIIAVPVIIAIVVFAYVCIKYYGPAYQDPGTAEEVAEETTDDTTDDTASEDTTVDDTETTTSYSTDTSHEVVEGDTVNIDYVGVIDGVQFDGGTGNYDLTIGSGAFIDGFEDQLIGAHVGDQVLVDVTFPENYSSEEVAGKDAEFTVTINGVYEE